MKRFSIILLALAMVIVLTACGAKEETTVATTAAVAETTVTTETTEATEATVATETTAEVETTAAEAVFATIEAKNCYADAGYIEFISGAEESAEYTFTAIDSEKVQWRVYLLDESFEEGFRYISQVAEPALEGDGTVSVAEGQFVYVNCSVNEFTEDAPDENAKLEVTVK
ncbi:MAG: hypothetical protein IKU13_05000 [Clostridia bacterium]|nr:hypothetical protein [Clostridia bacterium]MBR5265640.1 hypothetical protein [Clostridia bacterium]